MTAALAIGLVAIGALAIVVPVWAFLWTLRNLPRIERRTGPLRLVPRIVDAISQRFPELFWERNLRVGWLKGVAWHRSDVPVVGYADRHSANPGDGLRMYLSAALDRQSVRGRVQVYRFTSVTPGEDPVLWTSDDLDIPHWQLNFTASAVGTNWPPMLTVPVDPHWKPGFYLVDFVCNDGTRVGDLAYFVVTNPDCSGDLVVKLGTTTYQAYNSWGGHSLYNSHHVGRKRGGRTRGQIVGFDRPTLITRFRWYDQYYLAWLEAFCAREGLALDYATGIDVHLDPRYAANYKLFIATGHNEYWSGLEFDRIYRRIRSGRNVLFLGADTAFWEVRYLDLNQPPGAPYYPRHLVCHKDVTDPIRWRTRPDGSDLSHVSSRFRDGARRPETMLMGVGHGLGYDGAWNLKYDYRVHSTDITFFRDTGLVPGDTIASLIGHEWDKRDPAWDDLGFPPTGCGPRATRRFPGCRPSPFGSC
jgi:hypothetical protein